MKRKILFLLVAASAFVILFFVEITKFWELIMFVLGLISGILISKIFTKKHEKHFYTPDRDIHFKK